MLTNEDIEKLSAVLATKEDLENFYNKTEMDEKFSSLQTSTDKMIKLFKQYIEEQKIYIHRLDRIEDWIKQAAVKLGVDYKP